MRDKKSTICALLLAALLLAACATPAPTSAPAQPEAASDVPVEAAADTYFENGVIYTADDGQTIAEALAVKDGRIVFVGSAQDGAAYKAAAGEVVDLQGNMMMPGLIDGHIHSVTPDFFDFSLLGLTSAEETLNAIQAHVDANPDKDTYFGFGYMATLFEGAELENGPKKERLDEICPDKPLLIYSFDGHAAWLNSKAFEYCGITADTESTPGGVIVKDESGALWGTLQDTAMSFTASFPLDQEKLPQALKAFVQQLNSMGYTSIMTLPGNGFFPVPWQAYQEMADAGELTMRVRGASLVTSWQTQQDIETLAQLQAQYDGELLQLIGAKLFADGVADNESAYLLEPYSDSLDDRGVAGWQPQAMNEAVAAINKLGVLAHVHSMGDAATQMSLDAMAYSQTQGNSGDLRNALTHLQLVAEEDFPRFNELGVVAVANPYWHYKAPQYWEAKEYAALGQRAEHEYPMRSFLDSEVVLAFASDYPVTAMPNPFVAIQSGVTRNLVDGAEYMVPDITDPDDPACLLWPEERLDVQEMIRGFTLDAAYAIRAEEETGSLEVGKSADMIVLDRDLLTLDPLEIKDTQVLQTYFMGTLVYRAQ